MRMLSSIFRRLVEWGLGGVVAGVVAGIIPVGCDGLPRVVSRWSGLSRGQRVLPSGSWRAGDEFRVSTGRGWSSAAGGSCGAPRRGRGGVGHGEQLGEGQQVTGQGHDQAPDPVGRKPLQGKAVKPGVLGAADTVPWQRARSRWRTSRSAS